ncbi:hypothetical protein ACWGCW_00695 [Streptomyces sp. NPDC054933]
MSGPVRDGQAAEPVEDEHTDDPNYAPNPPYDPPAGQTWNEWMDR